MSRLNAAIGGILVGAMLLVLGTGSLVAHEDHATPGAAGGSDDMGMMGEATPGASGMLSADDLHETMHAMMDAVHGAGTTERMHEAMGPEGEELMAQCAGMMAMMMGMMGNDDMSGMMGGGDMMGGMGGQDVMGTPATTSEP